MLPVKQYLPHIAIVTIVATIMIGAYASVSLGATQPKVTWATNPLTISFSASIGSGTASDSFTCSPSTGPIQLRTNTNTAKVGLTTTPPSLSSCSSASNAVVMTATCVTPGPACVGTYSGNVQVRQPANYRNLPEVLKVVITVTP